MHVTMPTVRRLSLIAVLPALALIPAAHADNGITLGLDYGQAEARKFCDNITSCDSAGDSVKAEIGMQFTRGLAVELGYTSLGTILESQDSLFLASQESSALTLSGIATMSFTDHFGIYGRLGVAQYDTNSSGTVAGVPVQDQDGTTPFYGAGIKLGLSDNFSLRAEYQVYSDISRVDGKKDNVDGIFAGIQFTL